MTSFCKLIYAEIKNIKIFFVNFLILFLLEHKVIINFFLIKFAISTVLDIWPSPLSQAIIYFFHIFI